MEGGNMDKSETSLLVGNENRVGIPETGLWVGNVTRRSNADCTKMSSKKKILRILSENLVVETGPEVGFEMTEKRLGLQKTDLRVANIESMKQNDCAGAAPPDITFKVRVNSEQKLEAGAGGRTCLALYAEQVMQR